MKTLHEMAVKLQEYIIKSQEDAHNSTNMNVTKYNNLKLKMDSKIHYPHVIVCIGISEVVFNIAEGTKTDGGLGPDEKYVRKWLGNSTVLSDLKELYVAMSDLIRAEDEDKAVDLYLFEKSLISVHDEEFVSYFYSGYIVNETLNKKLLEIRKRGRKRE